MGNKLCKKKSDVVDNPKSPTQFDRIINRLHLRPNSWKSDSHLNQKQVNRCEVNQHDKNLTKPLSKSTDWTEAALEVPDKDEPIHLRNPKLSLIFDNEKSTPTPPPRKHKKGFRQKIEAVAKNGLQAFQSKKPVEEPLCIKKNINPTCPVCDHDCVIHNRDHKHEQSKNEINEKKNDVNLKEIEKQIKITDKEAKRRKNLSVVSLPNYNELKLTVAHFEDIDKKADNKICTSHISLPGETKKLSGGKLETCMTRCRSIGSLLPQQLLDKLKVRKMPADIESDDSFGALEDWDLKIIEHYNPKDTSLPRPRKLQKNNKETLSDIESLIVKDEDVETPKVPAHKSESLLKKINREDESAPVIRSQEPPKVLPAEENGVVEHSSLMRILEEFSIKDKQTNLSKNSDVCSEDRSPLISQSDNQPNQLITPSKFELGKSISSVEEFLNNEKLCNSKEIPHTKFGNMKMAKT